MGGLSASEIVSIWERGVGRHPVERALVLAGAACPSIEMEQLASVAIGRRDASLLRFRESLFGPAATASATCPNCREAMEFTVRTTDLAIDVPEAEGPFELAKEGLTLKFRLPDSRDLRAIAEYRDVETAKRVLAERCVVESSGAVSAEVAVDLAAEMAERDPMADISLELQCVACGCGWTVAFDIASFLWREIDALARRLLAEVHTLARAYGWSEAEILAMSPGRRGYYLEMAS
jgi:hypothetical protein